jgi:hypothetical protein
VNPGPISFTLLHRFTITRTVYFLAYYYYFPLDTLNPLFTANRWDWQPHRKLGAKYLVVLCAGSTLLLVQSKALDEAPYKSSRVVAKLADITFWRLAFSYWFDKPRFLTEGKLATVLIIPSSWGYQLGGYLPTSQGNGVHQSRRYWYQTTPSQGLKLARLLNDAQQQDPRRYLGIRG